MILELYKCFCDCRCYGSCYQEKEFDDLPCDTCDCHDFEIGEPERDVPRADLQG